MQPPRVGPPRRRSLRRVVLLGLVLGGVLGSHAAPGFAGDDAHTAHVAARGDVGAELLQSFVELGEACYPQWVAYFGIEPKKDRLPLAMDVRKDRDGFLRALTSAGVAGAAALAGAGGYYDPGSRVSYLYLQPHLSSTRLLVLHELTHQFQYKAVLGDRSDRSPTWHKEGLAEHFGCHRRTAKGLETGVLDMVAIDDRPTQCAKLVASGGFDPWAVGTGTAKTVDYTVALTMVETLLLTKDASLRAALRTWEKDLDKSADPFARFAKDFSGKQARLEAAVKEVWGEFRRPWKVVYIAWDEEPGFLVGRGLPWAFLEGQIPMKAEANAIEADLRVDGMQGGGGIALGVHGPDDLVSADLWAGGQLTLRVKKAGVWTLLGSATTTGAGPTGTTHLKLSTRGTAVLVEVGGFPAISVDVSGSGLTMLDLQGRAGLISESTTVRFANVHVGSPPP